LPAEVLPELISVRAKKPSVPMSSIHSYSFLAGGGEMGALMRAFDWSEGPLGTPATWPQTLRAQVRILLNTQHPMYIWWGPALICLYNDAYRQTLGPERHPGSLGQPGAQVWGEIWDIVEPQILQVMGGRGATWHEDQLVPITRHGRREDVYWTYSYSPIEDDDAPNGIGGVLVICTETTSKVLAEQRAAPELLRQRNLVQQMPGFVATLRGPDHIYEYVNDAYAAISGNRPLVGRPVRAVFPELEGQGFFELLDQVYRSGERYVARGVPISLSGESEPRFIDLLYEPIRDHAGATNGIFVGGYDATDIYRMADELTRSESRLRQVVEGAHDHAIMTVAADGLITSWSAGAQTTFGWGSEAMVGRAFGGLFTLADQAKNIHLERLAKAASGQTEVDEQWWVHRDGHEVYVAGSIHPLQSTVGGSVTEFLVIVRDETTRRRADGALKELTQALERRVEKQAQELHDSQDFARLALTAVGGVGVWTYDAVIDRFFYDESIATLYGIDPAQGPRGLSPAGFLQNVHPNDRAALTATMQGGLTKPGDLELEYRLRHADGSIRWVLSRGHTYFDAAGKPVRRTGVGIDMTKQRLMEEQFRQSQKMEAVGQLTGGIAHDFNNLLAGIGGSLEMLQIRVSQGKFDSVDRYVAAAQGAARRAAALTHRLLAFSRRQTLDPKSTDINRLVAEMEDLIRRTVGPQIELEVVGAGGLWPTLVDTNQLENALLNLCINARDAMPHGGRITIETANEWLDDRAATERDLNPGQYVSLCVTDTGTGMTPEVVARAFDPFFTTKPLGEGTGLGLSMIYGFARQSGGQARIHSEVGIGTTMCVYLPRDHAKSQTELLAESLHEISLKGSGQVVLVVEDEPTVRMLIVEVLQDAGYAAIEAVDGSSSVRVLRSDVRVDLLITDVGLPGGMNGRQIADEARVYRPNLKVLFITGYAENAVVGNGHLEAGMEILTKPFAIDALAQRVERLLAGANGV
jgi:PAS domain S-box-containing protein